MTADAALRRRAARPGGRRRRRSPSARRRTGGSPPPVLLRLGMNGIFNAGGVVLRVGRVTADPAAAIELADAARPTGVRVPQPARPDAVVDGELTATAWERLELVDAAPDWRAIGRMVRAVHALPADDGARPGTRCRAAPTSRGGDFDDLLADVGDDLDRRRRARRARRRRSSATAAGPTRRRPRSCATATSTRATSR